MERFDNTNAFHQLIVELWHTSRTALADQQYQGGYERKQYIAKELRNRYPELVKDMSAKRLWLTICEVLA